MAIHQQPAPSSGIEEGVLRAIIFANGGYPNPAVLLPGDVIIAADGGARHCLALGLTPHLVVGDFDSLDEEQLDQLRVAGSKLIQYPTRKDYTDLELALQHARQLGAREVVVFAALGGRWDQTLANILLPASHEFASMPIHLVDGQQEIQLIHPGQPVVLRGLPGDTLSLIPLNDDAHGVKTSNLEYALHGETLHFGSTRGVSNRLAAETATVSLEAGVLCCIVIHQDIR
jgi:thiamine pyrophosphokinase